MTTNDFDDVLNDCIGLAVVTVGAVIGSLVRPTVGGDQARADWDLWRRMFTAAAGNGVIRYG